jgi:hypothetical protein
MKVIKRLLKPNTQKAKEEEEKEEISQQVT